MNKYPKSEKLCSRKILEELVRSSNIIYSSPLKVYWKITNLPEKVAAQSAVSVSKKKFKLAVLRNLLKRRIREAFRINKFKLYEKLKAENKQMALLIVYKKTDVFKFKEIEKAMIYVLKSLCEIIDK